MGSLIAPAQVDKVAGMVERAREGAEVVVGGRRPDRPGAFYEPTVIAGPDQGSEIVQDEVFGPVVTVQRFSRRGAGDRAGRNDVRFGLAASVFTSDIGRAMRVAKALQFGTVWINEHFTLVVRDAARRLQAVRAGARTSPPTRIEDYTVVKHVMINLGA